MTARARWGALGTTAEVLVTAAPALAAARRAVQSELAAIDAACSRFRDDSELSRCNAAAGHPVAVGDLLIEALAVAMRAAVLTDGAVDPTVGEAVVRAGYDRDFAQLRQSDAPVAAGRVPGWRAVSVDRDHGTVRLPVGVRLDLGATAKAFAADRAARAAERAAGGAGVLVSLGGDIAVAGPAPEDGWAVRVADSHLAGPDAPGQAVTIRSGGLATSSTTVRRWGAERHHIIDPASGRPAREWWLTVSVAAATCVDANTASTAAIVRGALAAAWLRDRRMPARLVDGAGRTLTVGGWPADTS